MHFSNTDKHEALEIIEQAQQSILNTIEYIRSNLSFPEPEITFKDKLNSSFINEIFYPMFVHSKKFHVTKDCISCGKWKISVHWEILNFKIKSQIGENIVPIVCQYLSMSKRGY